MDKNSTYSFDLSSEELYWLAASFGLTSLPVLDEVWRGHSIQESEKDLQKGNASLLDRGLVRPSPGFGWQVDRLPTAIVQWLSSADALVKVENISKNGSTSIAHVFTAGERGMSIEMDTDNIRFTLYETRAALIESLLSWLALPNSSTEKGITFQLPQPETFLPAVWKDPNLAERMLKTVGISTNDEIAAWIQSLAYIIVVSKVKLDGRINTISDQFVFCGQEKSIWGGRLENEKVTFVPISKDEIIATIDNML